MRTTIKSEPRLLEFARVPQGAQVFVVLDRDDTLIRDSGYMCSPASITWIDGALAALKTLTEAGFPIFVATNQSGVARGMFDVAAMDKFHRTLARQARDAGGVINAIIACPHLRDGSVRRYAVQCNCRKPLPGLFSALCLRYSLSPSLGVCGGDQDRDAAAAVGAGMIAVQGRGPDLLDEVVNVAKAMRMRLS